MHYESSSSLKHAHSVNNVVPLTIRNSARPSVTKICTFSLILASLSSVQGGERGITCGMTLRPPSTTATLALSENGMVQRFKSLSVIVFHVSCHGSQTEDNHRH